MTDRWYLIHYESVDGGRIQRPRHVLGIAGIEGFASLGLSGAEVGQTRALVRVYGDAGALDALGATAGVTELPDAAVGSITQVYQQRTGRSRTREQIESDIRIGANVGTGSGSYTDDFNRGDEHLEVSSNWSRSAGDAGDLQVISNQVATPDHDTSRNAFYQWAGGDVHARLYRHVWHAIREGRDPGAAPAPVLAPAPRSEAPPHLSLGSGSGTEPAPPDDLDTGTGPGSQLMRMLKAIGITSEPGCACRARARRMNEWGPQGCRQQFDTIVGWLQEEAQRRGLPFSGLAARILVRRAIRRAEREEATARG